MTFNMEHSVGFVYIHQERKNAEPVHRSEASLDAVQVLPLSAVVWRGRPLIDQKPIRRRTCIAAARYSLVR